MTPQLQAIEEASGAVFTRYAERDLPARFGDRTAEWTAVRQRCGMFDAGFRSLLRLRGADRTTFLQGMVTNDVAKLHDGGGTYAALLTIQGRVVADLRVYVLSDEVWLDVPATHAVAVRAALDRYIIADDVEWVESEDCVPLVAVEGPQAGDVLATLGIGALGDLPQYAHRQATVDGVAVRVVAVSHTGEAGVLLIGDPQIAGALWERCRAAGAEPVGMDVLDVLRVEAGIPWCGRDMDESTLISETGLEAAVSFTKGCYLGQEVVERVAARGQVQRKLVGLHCDGADVPLPAATLWHDEKEAGRITSAVMSPAQQAVIALAYVRRESWDVGTAVRVTSGQQTTMARVVALPFYRRAAA